MNNPIKVNDKVVIVKGCRARDISKGKMFYIAGIEDKGAEYSHMVAITLSMPGRKITFWARHMNRLSDDVINLNDGNPLNKIQIKRLTW
jgi:hypothetical protein